MIKKCQKEMKYSKIHVILIIICQVQNEILRAYTERT
jgi:hypothetical protein